MSTFGILFGIFISLALLYWLASLAQEYFTNPAERARLNSKPADLLFVIFAAVFMVMPGVPCIAPSIECCDGPSRIVAHGVPQSIAAVSLTKSAALLV
jgi:hypothetical protein